MNKHAMYATLRTCSDGITAKQRTAMLALKSRTSTAKLASAAKVFDSSNISPWQADTSYAAKVIVKMFAGTQRKRRRRRFESEHVRLLDD